MQYTFQDSLKGKYLGQNSLPDLSLEKNKICEIGEKDLERLILEFLILSAIQYFIILIYMNREGPQEIFLPVTFLLLLFISLIATT